MDISAYHKIKSELPDNCRLIAVSKTKPASDIAVLYEHGQRDFAENKVQELKEKYEKLPKDIKWHFIGHLQTNKIKYIAPFISLIHSIDSLSLLKEVDKMAKKSGRIIPCLLQFHIAQETTKFGFTWEEAEKMLASDEFSALKNVKIVGVMGMGTHTEDTEQTRKEFHQLRQYFLRLKDTRFARQPDFRELSMGMTDDYPIAVQEQSTMVRIGSAIFGNRIYPDKTK